MTYTSSRVMITVGRFLLALYFLLPGIAKLLSPASQLVMMQNNGIPAALPLLYIAGAAQLIGAILLLTNRFVGFTALGFVFYILIINVMIHGFWRFEGLAAAHEMQNFFKNLGVLAGLLVLAGQSPKRKLSLRNLPLSDRQITNS